MTKTITKEKGDTIRFKMKDGTLEDVMIESIDVITIRNKKKGGIKKERRTWATILVPAVLHIDKCHHKILQRQQLNLDIYKEPPKAKKSKGEKKTGTSAMRKRTSSEPKRRSLEA